jgi:glucose/arabinose dehydrogenase
LQVGVCGSVRRLVLALLLLPVLGCSGDGPETTPTPNTVAGPTTEPETTTERVPAGPLRVRLKLVASGLEAPVHLASTPSEPERLYVVEQVGRIRIVEGGRVLGRPFLDIASDVRAGGEQGLLSVAFAPDYETSRRFYVNYTDLNGDTRVVEFEVRSAGPPARRRELLFVEQPYANHNGGQLAFGPDGRLYVGMGDGGSGGDPENRAQNLEERLGKLLSLDVAEQGVEWRLEGLGLRNPWRFSFDRETGDLWIADVGQGDWEEIDFLPRESPGVENYGWDVYEGTHVFEEKEPNPRGELVMPVAEYSHGESCSITGGFVYRGESVPAAAGRYFYGDYCSGFVWALSPRGDGVSQPRRLPFEVPGLSSFGEDTAGELYLTSLVGDVYRLEAR